MLSPFALNWWIHGDYERYIWIIRGPYPYSNFGGGPFQLAMYVGLFLFGVILIVVSLVGRKFFNKSKAKKEFVAKERNQL